MNTGERIKKRRNELGLSVDEVAERLGKNRATVYRYENNDIENLPTTVLEPLADILKTTPAFLMGWDERKEKMQQALNERTLFHKFLGALGWKFIYTPHNDDKPMTCRIENKNSSIILDVSVNEPDIFFEETKIFMQKYIQKLINSNAFPDLHELGVIENCTIIEFPMSKDSCDTNAAHARTDIEIPEDADTTENDIMNNENF